MKPLSRIGLGTAQFGHDYGVSNRQGRPNELEIGKILAQAAAAGVGYLDTAFDYGPAEAIIGCHLPAGHSLRIVTKLPRIEAASIDAGHCRAMLDSLATSLDRLKQSEIHAVLIHNVADLAKPGSAHLIAALRQAKERGWVGRIGASIYDGEQLALVESCFDPDLVQAPLNVLDRWLLTTGALARLKRKGVEVHARSAFLQGLLLMAPDELPEFFSPVRPYIADWQRRCAAEGVSVVAGCLAYVLGHRAVDAVIVGVNNAAELSEIQAALAAATDVAVEFGGLPPLERSHIDPRCWPGATH